MRCDTCGARNVDAAAWCTQCYTPFQAAAPVTPDPEQPIVPSPPTESAGPADPDSQDDSGPDTSSTARLQPVDDADGGLTTTPPSAAQPGPSSQTAGPSDRDIRDIDGRIEWRCATCTSWMALEEPACTTCGGARVGFGDPVSPTADVVDVPEATLLGASAVLPGAGHLLVGRVGSGITRAVLFLLWAAGGLWWILSTQDGRSPGIVLLIGAAVLWGATLVDANAIAKGQSVEPFGVRGLLWTVVGVTGLLMLLVAFVAAGSLGG